MISNFFFRRIIASLSYKVLLIITTSIMVLTFLGMHPFNYGLYRGHTILRMTFVLVGNGESAFSFLSTAMYSLLPLFILGGVTINQISDQKSGFDVAIMARLGYKKYLQQLYIGSGMTSGLLFIGPLLLNHLIVLGSRLVITKSYADPIGPEVIMPLKSDLIWHWGVWSWQHLLMTDILYSLGNTWLFIIFGTVLVSLGLIVTKLYQLVLLTLAIYLPFWAGGSLSINKLMQPLIPAYLNHIILGYVVLTIGAIVFNSLVYRYFVRWHIS